MGYSINGLIRPHHVQEAINASSGTDTLDDALLALQGVRSISGRNSLCPKCAGVGTHDLAQDTGISSDTEQVQCTFVSADDPENFCGGWGYLFTSVVADRAAMMGLFRNVPS